MFIKVHLFDNINGKQEPRPHKLQKELPRAPASCTLPELPMTWRIRVLPPRAHWTSASDIFHRRRRQRCAGRRQIPGISSRSTIATLTCPESAAISLTWIELEAMRLMNRKPYDAALPDRKKWGSRLPTIERRSAASPSWQKQRHENEDRRQVFSSSKRQVHTRRNRLDLFKFPRKALCPLPRPCQTSW